MERELTRGGVAGSAGSAPGVPDTGGEGESEAGAAAGAAGSAGAMVRGGRVEWGGGVSGAVGGRGFGDASVSGEEVEGALRTYLGELGLRRDPDSGVLGVVPPESVGMPLKAGMAVRLAGAGVLERLCAAVQEVDIGNERDRSFILRVFGQMVKMMPVESVSRGKMSVEVEGGIEGELRGLGRRELVSELVRVAREVEDLEGRFEKARLGRSEGRVIDVEVGGGGDE